LPGEQGEQISSLFVVSSNWPAKHSEQDKLPFGAVLPVPQASQGVARWRSVAAVSLVHSWQAVCFTSLLNLPGIHGRQYANPFSFW